MSVHPEIERTGSLEHLKLGRAAVRHDPRTLRLASYLDAELVLPEVPTAEDWTLGVRSWPMMGNDSLGDCTCAAAGHMLQAWTAAAGRPRTPTDAAVLAMYWATGKGDTGRYEVDVLNYWRRVGLGGDKIVAYAYVNPLDARMMRAAIHLFGGLYVGIALPKTAQRQTVWDLVGDGKTGPSAPGSWGGHAVPLHAYRYDGESTRFTCVTWGAKLDLTQSFWLTYGDEAYAVISRDWLDGHGKSPAGFNLRALRRDLKAVVGS